MPGIVEGASKFKKIAASAEELKVSFRDLRSLGSVQRLLYAAPKKREFKLFHAVMVIGLALMVSHIFTFRDGLLKHPLIRPLFFSDQTVVNREKCVTYIPNFLSNLLRPPEDCSICLNITQVDKLANVSPEEFERRYIESGRPAVITDAMVNWTGRDVFSFEFFKKVYEDSSTHSILDSACQFFPYKTEFRNLGDVFRMDQSRSNLSAGTEPWYVGWSNCDEKVSRILRKHYQPPYFLPQTSANKQTDWIFMGSPGYGAKMHIDNVNYPSWQAQLRGYKTWTLQPPLECYYKCDTISVDVHPGEINTNRWYHETLIISDELSITIGAEFD